MRALCEACGRAQPPDWTPGEQCVHCGKAVRRELRCFWCAKWTPAAKFCRSCGAETVEPRLYGAARMLKDAGTDRFSVPKQLREFDPDQVENFSRIYQRHAMAVARHVDELRFLERFLFQKAWSDALEEELIPQLPWPEQTLEALSAPAAPPPDDLSAARALQKSSPFPLTRALAALVRLKLDDWGAYKDAAPVFRSGDPALKAEAALVLTGWRVLCGAGRPRDDRREIFEELRRSPFKLEAAVRMALLGGEASDLVRDALASPDPETAFGAALALGDVDRLRAALEKGELEKIAAGSKLIELGVIQPVVETVEKSPLEVQRELVEGLLARKGPAPEAAETLLKIVETTEDETLRERAARILCRDLKPAWVGRIARVAGDDAHIYQSLLQAKGLTPEAAVELGDFLIRDGRFGRGQWGLETVAKGSMPLSFVPTRFGEADEKTRMDLLRFAETQLKTREDVEELHRFMLRTAFGPYSAKIRAGAWWGLRRWYADQGDRRGEGPFALSKPVIERFFGSVAAFVPLLAAVLRDRETLKEVGYYEMIAHVLVGADAATLPELRSEELLDALLEGMRGDYWPNTVEAMLRLAARLGADERWRSKTLDALRALNKKGSYYYDKALRTLELSAHGIPEEAAWKDLPPDFVPSRFAAASAEGRAELLELAEQQLIHKWSDVLGPFLLDLALRPGPLREEAERIYEDRVRARVALHKADVERVYGDYVRFLELLPEALKEGFMADTLRELFRDPKPSDAVEVAAAGEAGRALLDAARNKNERRWLEVVDKPRPTADALAKEHQEKLSRLLAGPGDRGAKEREARLLGEAYRAKIKDLCS